MKFYAITIKPESGIGTPIKGDTLFGQFCWEVVLDPSLVEGGIDAQLEKYNEKPFLIFSSAFLKLGENEGSPVCALRRPALPTTDKIWTEPKRRLEVFLNRKIEKKKNYILYRYQTKPLKAGTFELLDDQMIYHIVEQQGFYTGSTGIINSKQFMVEVMQPHNTVNRLTGTTGLPPFAPYNCNVIHYIPGIELVLFLLLDEEATDISRVLEALERIGKFGFGRDASIGMGKFTVVDGRQLDLPDFESANARYTLAPCVPEVNKFRETYFRPFVRFGKHGGVLARSDNPFKNPVVMADEGSVFVLSDDDQKPYIGRAVRNVSKVQKNAVVQGYSPCLPIVLEN